MIQSRVRQKGEPESRTGKEEFLNYTQLAKTEKQGLVLLPGRETDKLAVDGERSWVVVLLVVINGLNSAVWVNEGSKAGKQQR